jgi:urea transport system ATP-binding protein
MMLLQLDNIDQFYGESHTLWDVSLGIEEGTVTCLMGRNGVGKTTLLKSIMGLLRVAKGSIRIGDRELLGNPPEFRARVGIGYIPQGREIFPQLSVEENLRVCIGGSKGRGNGSIPDKVFEMFPVLKQMLRRRGGDLSGGQQQQLAIGRALTLNPKLLILDEPTEGIQPNIVHEIGDILIDLARNGLGILLVEQKLPFARRVGQRFCLMNRGRVVKTGAMNELDDHTVEEHLHV